MAEEEIALGLQGTKRIENIQMGLTRAEEYKKVNIYVRNNKTVMKGDFDSPAKLEIF